MAYLNAAIDGSGITRKVLAEDHLQISEGELSKLTSSGRFRMDLVDKLPAVIRVDWIRRMDEHESQSIAREAVIMERAAHALIDALAIVKGRAMVKAGL